MKYSQTCIKRSSIGQRKSGHLPLKRGSIHMKFSMTGQGKYDLFSLNTGGCLIEVTSRVGVTVY